MAGDVIEIGEGEAWILRRTSHAPPRKYLDSLIVSGTLQELEGEA